MKTIEGSKLALCIVDDNDNVLAVGKDQVTGYGQQFCEDLETILGHGAYKEIATILENEFKHHDLVPQIETLLREVHETGEIVLNGLDRDLQL